jgi:hypothetical protein
MSIRWTLLVALLAGMTGCGYVGDPLPPALRIPGPITDLQVSQVGDRVVVRLTIPPLTTENLPLRLGKVELLAGTSKQPFDESAWRAAARSLGEAITSAGPVSVEVSAEPWTGEDVFFRARVLSDKGRDGGWSDYAVLRVIPPLTRPQGLKAEPVAEGVMLSWTLLAEAQGVSFRVRRRAGKGTFVETATVKDRRWLDTQTVYGETYEYSVQSLVTEGGARAESALSETITIKPVDEFPPAVPSGITAVAAPSSIELTWEPNTEADFACYRLYRAVGDQPFARISDGLRVPSYSDREARPGVRQRYQLSAVDRLGNESACSPVVEVTPPAN